MGVLSRVAAQFIQPSYDGKYYGRYPLGNKPNPGLVATFAAIAVATTSLASTFVPPTLTQIESFGFVVATDLISKGIYSANADPTGVANSTLAIQAAIDYGAANWLPVYLPASQPNGTPATGSIINDMLRGYSWIPWPQGDYGGSGGIVNRTYHQFYGGWRADGVKATLKLAATAARFDSPDPNFGTLPTPMFIWATFQGLNSSATTANILTGSAAAAVPPYTAGGGKSYNWRFAMD